MSTEPTATDYEKLWGDVCAENFKLKEKIRWLEHQHKNDEAASRMLLSVLDHHEKSQQPKIRITA